MAETLDSALFAPKVLAAPRGVRRPRDWRPVWTHSPVETIDVSVCIANWNCIEYLRACLQSLLDQPQGVTLEIIIADNASADGAPEMVAREFPEVTLIRNTENLGFAKASNQAAEAASGQYLFFLNNDTVVPEFTLEKLTTFARAHPNFGMIGPRLRDGKGKLQISYRRKPTLKAMLHRASVLRWTGIFRKAYDDYRRDGFEPDGVRRVEVLMGAAVLVPRDVYRDCGGWDEGFIFGVEDVEYSDRIGRSKACVYVPGIEIIHYGRVSSRQNVTFAAPNLMIGYARYFRKSGVPAWSLIGYKLVFTLDAPMQFLTMCVQYFWRRVTGASPAHVGKSRMGALGIWRFLTREIARFWRA
ncbi:glycosyltransferase family 2 protein [Zavarzinella formosa]|uniref:glycosyltransferase family 2 protein n=1 Tax=Zavarzinella formosa TaxID=360055 RepID=UPI000301E916|nr:glycosyltransferase family 2 protein [Zavarzinella formosa]